MKRSVTPEELGLELRESSKPFLRRRRGIIGLCFVSCAALGAVALYQIGILKKLPQPCWPRFSTRKVHASRQAYAMLQVPDAFPGLLSYSMTACLAAAGTEERSRTQPLIPIAMGCKLLGDAIVAGKLTLDESRKLHASSVWSLLAAVCTWAALPIAWPEVKAALREASGNNGRID